MKETRRVRDVLQHLNNIQPHIEFTMELEKDGALPFLDVLIKKFFKLYHLV